LVALILGSLGSLRIASVRQAILARASAYLAQEFGLALTAADFVPRWNGFELREVRLGVPGAPPVVTAERLRAEIDLRSLRREVAVIRSLEIDAPRVDLAAPIPSLPEDPEPAGPPGFEIRRIVVRRGSVVGPPPEKPLADWVTAWSAEGIEARASFRDGLWAAVIEEAWARVERPGFAPLELRAAGRVRYRDGEPLGFEEVRVTGDGGLLRANGNLALPAASGRVALSAEAIPAEMARPYLEEGLFADLSLAGTVADARADVTIGPGSLDRVAGEGEVTWRRGERRLARIEARAAPGEPGLPILLVATGELLPGSPGRRTFGVTLRAAGWAEMAQGQAEDGRAELRLPDVAAALAEARSLWPRLVPVIPEEAPVRGSLAADARFSGRLGSPRAALKADWVPEPGARVHVDAQGLPLAGSGSADVRIENLTLGVLGGVLGPAAQGASGTVSGTARLDGSKRSLRTRVDATATALAFPPSLQGLESAIVTAEGVLAIDPLVYDGKVAVEGARLVATVNASGTARVERFQLAAEGVFKPEPLSYTGTVSLDGTGVAVPGTAEVDHLQLAADGSFAGDLQSLAGRATLDAGRVALAETEVRDLHLEAEGGGPEVRIAALSGSLPEGRTFAASGRFTTEPLLAEADLSLQLANPVDAVRSAAIMAGLRRGILDLSAPGVDTAAGPVSLTATVPLGALLEVPQFAEALRDLPLEWTPGPVSLQLEAPAVDSATLLPALGLDPRPERVRAGVSADLTVDLSAPAAGRGDVRITGLRAETPDGSVAADGVATLRLADGRLELLPVHLRVEGAGLPGAGIDLRGAADLARSWRPLEDPPAALVTGVSAEAGGTIEAALLNPYLEGGAATGSLSFAASASGPLDALAGEVRASGPGASFFWPAPYVTRLQAPEVAVSVRDGRWTIREGRALLNTGTVNLTGGGGEEGAAVEARFSGVRYRFDYGLSALLSGQLGLSVPPEGGRMGLAGRVSLDRGVLDRDINLDREVIALLFQPEDSPGTEESLLQEIDLDLRVDTVDGVRVRNNVGDLRLSWAEPLSITGTAEVPIVRGRVEVDPDGILYAYGQKARIDRAVFTFTGDPLTDPLIDLATTSSIEDPTIASLGGAGRSPLALLDQPIEPGDEAEGANLDRAQDMVAGGLTGYYGARILSRLSESMGLGGVTVRPDFAFDQNNDPSARLTLGRDVSRNVSFVVSVDLRNAERQTYLLDLHDFRGLPRLTGEVFTTDRGQEGARLQQVLELGGGPPARVEGPRLRRLTVHMEGQVLRRLLRRAIRLEKKEPVPEGAAFEAELDAAGFLRALGYPDPRIAVSVTPVGSRPGWVDVAVSVEPGPRVAFRFEGDRPPRALRPEITALYRTDFYEPNSVEEMKKAVVRAFRALGHLDPRVEVAVARERPEDPDGPRAVTIQSAAGPRSSLVELRIEGLDSEEARLAAGRFPGRLSRAELAAGLPDADRRLLDALRALGYPEARVLGRAVEEDGARFAVRVEPGERQRLGRVEVTGVDAEERRRLLALLPLRDGDPARRDRISQGALLLEQDLRGRGFADATVRATTRPASPGSPAAFDVLYEVTPGVSYTVAGVGFEGERWMSEARLAEVAALDTGAVLDGAAVDQARSRLFETGLFSRVTADVDRREDGAARVAFSLTEKPRFRIGYGARWQSGDEDGGAGGGGTSAALDLMDQNFLGRGLILGLQGLYEPNDQSGRLYLRTGGLAGTDLSLETYGLVRRRLPEEGFVEDIREAAVQLSHPLGSRTTARAYARYRSTHLFEEEPDPFFPLDLKIDYPTVGAQLVRDTRDDWVDPARGLLASLDLSGSGGWLGSDFDFARLFGQVSLFREISLAGRSMVWAQSARVGWARPGSGQELIREERFFAGGEHSVRGYDTETLGPLESLGDFTRAEGGEALFILNQELRVRLPWDLTGLVFFDAGQAWADPGDIGTDLSKALGIGVRARTPLGLLRFDAGFPLDRRPEDESYKLYFGLGNAF
jgi:outer membrane protein assembly factor BamA